MVVQMASTHERVVTLEENVVAGGAGSAVNECLAAHGILRPIRNIGLPDRFIDQGERGELLAEAGLDVDGLLEALRENSRPEVVKSIRSK
jgi:1-deoxy-D-xylulose-5-phosphate synthase